MTNKMPACDLDMAGFKKNQLKLSNTKYNNNNETVMTRKHDWNGKINRPLNVLIWPDLIRIMSFGSNRNVDLEEGGSGAGESHEIPP